MIQLDFLGAADNTPLTKQFQLTSKGEIDITPYPFVKNFNSHRENCSDIAEVFTALKTHSEQNHCLVKGLLSTQLINASRAGLTSAGDDTMWVLLDLDFESGWDSVDAFIEAVNPAWKDVSYIFQHSASAGIRCDAGLRGHIFILLENEISPSVLKQWLKERNLAIKGLKDQIELAANGLSLRWPLDTTTCQNDKLIYIANPIVDGGLIDPLKGERIVLKRKGKDFAPLPTLAKATAVLEHEADDVIANLRRDMGLPARTPRYKTVGPMNVLQNPEAVTITGVKEERGFVYLNLNGGDSWAYFFPRSNPEIVRNFKGEPPVFLRDLDQEFYAQFKQEEMASRHGEQRPYVFREPRRDEYYNMVYNASSKVIDMLAPVGSKDKMRDFMAQYGHGLPDPIEDWTLEFDPTRVEVLDPKHRWANLFEPSDYIKAAAYLDEYTEIPPIIDRVITSICVDKETKDHFLHWLAWIFQTRRKAQTSWIFHGTPGTGKGVLQSRILTPLFGKKQVMPIQMQVFEEGFNAAMEHCCILWLDEFEVESAYKANVVMGKLKNLTTEETFMLRAMRTNAYSVRNWMNIIIVANQPDPIKVAMDDRRFNVAPAQLHRLVMTTEEVEHGIEAELPAFASFLYHFKTNEDKVKQVLDNKARQDMMEASTNTVDQFFHHLLKGNIEWFADYLSTDLPPDNMLSYTAFEGVMRKWVKRGLESALFREMRQIDVSRDELMIVYNYLVGSQISKAKFSRMCTIHNVPLVKRRFNGPPTKATSMFTSMPIEELQELWDNYFAKGRAADNKVTPIRSA